MKNGIYEVERVELWILTLWFIVMFEVIYYRENADIFRSKQFITRKMGDHFLSEAKRLMGLIQNRNMWKFC